MDVKNSFLQGLKILIADADEDTRLLYAEVFTYHGAEVVVAGAILQAEAASTQFHPDVVIADLVLEGRYVYDFLPEFEQRSVIVTTAVICRDEQERALMRGIDFYLLKPVELDALVDAVCHSVQVRPVLCAC